MTLPNGPYEATNTEPEILNYWLENKFFKPEYHPEKGLLSFEEMLEDTRESFTIVNPPPNAYMKPHIGNVSGYAYQDIFLRYNRMLGKKVLGQPGKDHAGIQGEVVVEGIFIKNKGKTKIDMGREKFYKASYAHFEKLMPMIMADEQRIGLSSDYDRNLFTLDPKIVETVLGTFIKMFGDKMVYKGVRIVNWDPVAKTTLADIDTERVERDSQLVYIGYPLIKSRAWKLSFRDHDNFDRIAQGAKTIETRALNPDEKDRFFGDIKEGDLIICVDKTERALPSQYLKAGKVIIAKDFKEALAKFDWQKISGKEFKDEHELAAWYAKLAPDYAKKIEANGIISIELVSLTEADLVQVATTRPETMLGDTAVIVNPKDERYADLIGQKVMLPLVDREIPIITSARVEKEFGTGAVKLTPAHAYDDYVMMNEWNLEHPEQSVGYLNIINKDGKMDGPIPAKYRGLKTEEARTEVVKDLTKLVIKTEPHKQSVMVGERSKAVVEQIMSSQWFIDVERLKQPAIDAVKNGDIKIHPAYMAKKYLNWMENLHDWPVSRSLWWGYRIPVWYKGELKETINSEGQVVESIQGTEIRDINDAVEKGLAKVQVDPPGINLTIVRHGQTDDNVNGIFAGPTDRPLNNTGRIQALRFAKGLKQSMQQFDVIISSPLKRTTETAAIIAKELKLKVETDELLKERFYGELEGLTWEQFEEKYPALAAKNSKTYQPELPGGETIPTVEQRAKKFIDKVKTEYPDKKVLIVTHAGMIRVFKRLLLGMTDEQSRKNDPDNLDFIKADIAEPGWIQDEDVFDTWFSSGQWAYATLIANQLIDKFYPTDIMETAYDILELWVSRMIMLGLYTQGEIPFKHVYLHGLVKAPDGQKMSKSKGNVIQPEDIINKYGADSLRLLYVVGNKAGAGYPVSYEKLEGYKRFLNKIWNASKFVLNNIEDEKERLATLSDKELQFEQADLDMRSHLNELIKETTRRMNTYNIGVAALELYDSFWHTFADKYIEDVKNRLYTKDKESNAINTDAKSKAKRLSAQWTLYHSLKIYLRLLHPFIPFITEKVWQSLPKLKGESNTIMHANWPGKHDN